jgi:hypothetical protein
MSLLADNLSLISKKQARPVCSKIAISSVVVLLEKKINGTSQKICMAPLENSKLNFVLLRRGNYR